MRVNISKVETLVVLTAVFLQASCLVSVKFCAPDQAPPVQKKVLSAVVVDGQERHVVSTSSSRVSKMLNKQSKALFNCVVP